MLVLLLWHRGCLSDITGALFCCSGTLWMVPCFTFCFCVLVTAFCMFLSKWHFLLVHTTIASLTPLLSWLKGAPPGINPSSRQQKKKTFACLQNVLVEIGDYACRYCLGQQTAVFADHSTATESQHRVFPNEAGPPYDKQKDSDGAAKRKYCTFIIKMKQKHAQKVHLNNKTKQRTSQHCHFVARVVK